MVPTVEEIPIVETVVKEEVKVVEAAPVAAAPVPTLVAETVQIHDEYNADALMESIRSALAEQEAPVAVAPEVSAPVAEEVEIPAKSAPAEPVVEATVTEQVESSAVEAPVAENVEAVAVEAPIEEVPEAFVETVLSPPAAIDVSEGESEAIEVAQVNMI